MATKIEINNITTKIEIGGKPITVELAKYSLGGVPTDLSYTASPTDGLVNSSSGTSATIPATDGTNAGLFLPAEKTKLAGIQAGAEVNVNADWNAVSGDAQILNKPTLATVATSGSYNDLINKPTIPPTQVNSDWNSTNGVSQILNKPTLVTDHTQLTSIGTNTHSQIDTALTRLASTSGTNTGDQDLSPYATIVNLAKRLFKTAIVIGQDDDCDIKWTNAQDFTTTLLTAISQAQSGGYRQVLIKPGLYLHDTPIDIVFDSLIRIEGLRWETRFGTEGVMIKYRGSLTDYQISFKGNTLVGVTNPNQYGVTLTKGLHVRHIAFDGGNIAQTTIKTKNNVYLFNQDRVEFEFCRFINSCSNIDHACDMPDTALNPIIPALQPGGTYFNRCNFQALGGNGTSENYWIRYTLNTQCWLSNCWFASSTSAEYGFVFDRADKVKIVNCEFNEVGTSTFLYKDGGQAGVHDITISGCVIIPPTSGNVAITNCTSNKSTNNPIASSSITFTTTPLVNLGTNTDVVNIDPSSNVGYSATSADDNKLIRYKHTKGGKLSGVFANLIGALGTGLGKRLAMLTIKIPANFTGTGTVSTTSGLSTVTGVGTIFTDEYAPGDYIVVGGETRTVNVVVSDTSLTTTGQWTGTFTNQAHTVRKSALRIESASGVVYQYISNDGLIGFNTTSPGARMQLTGIANNIQMLIRGFSTQTAKLFSLQQSNTTEVFGVDNSGNVNTSGYVSLTAQTAPTYQEGRVWYDTDTRSLSYYDNYSGTSIQTGKELVVDVRNNSGATILNGQVVYVSGAVGQLPTIALARADSLATSQIIGVATHDIANNTNGKVTFVGVVDNFDTSAFTDGQAVYLSATTAGALTATPPASPNNVVFIGYITNANPSQGRLIVMSNRAVTNNNTLGTSQLAPVTENAVKTYVDTGLASKQNTLLSGTNIKTINGASVLGSGDLTVGGVTNGQSIINALIFG